ncbi:MAG: glycosyltransferase family 1 protein, partial [Clostridia bacterium]|nr:glycosyltransferase family 1 protein [Clostridia bacterium]
TEVVGAAGLTVPRAATAAMTEAMHALAFDDALCDALSRRGLARAGMFTWTASAAILARALAQVAEG